MKIKPWKIIDTILEVGKSFAGAATPLGLVIRGVDAVLPGDSEDDTAKTQALVEAAKQKTTEVRNEGDVSIKDTVKELALGFVATHPDLIQGFLDKIEDASETAIKKIDLPGIEGEDETEVDSSLAGAFEGYWNGLIEKRIMAAVAAQKS